MSLIHLTTKDFKGVVKVIDQNVPERIVYVDPITNIFDEVYLEDVIVIEPLPNVTLIG